MASKLLSPGSFSSSSLSTTDCNYHVFLSFRGFDTRKTFLGHLYTALVQAGIHTFKDDEELPIGEEISPHLKKAIQDSKISIVVFSKDYAGSRWCLEELVEILECRNTKGRAVFPIFYGVEPSHVRKQEGSFKKAFKEYEEKEDKEKINKWKNALRDAANLSGKEATAAANGLDRFTRIDPRGRIMMAIKWIVKYLEGKSRMYLCYEGADPILKGYIAKNMIENLDSRRSTSRFVYTFVGEVEKCVTLPTTEAKK